MSPSEPATRRLFVAIRPSASVTAELRALVAGLAEELGPSVRWSPPEGYHVTLHYIGDAPVDPVVEALDRVLPVGPTTVELGPGLIELGSAIVAPATGADDVAGLVGAAVGRFGPPQPERAFLGHLTIGRWRRGQGGDQLIGRPVSGRFTAPTVELLASATGAEDEAEESRYETIIAWPAVEG